MNKKVQETFDEQSSIGTELIVWQFGKQTLVEFTVWGILWFRRGGGGAGVGLYSGALVGWLHC